MRTLHYFRSVSHTVLFLLSHVAQTLSTRHMLLDVKVCIAEKAKAFWGNVDVDRVFDELLQHLVHLRQLIKTNKASDKGKHSIRPT